MISSFSPISKTINIIRSPWFLGSAIGVSIALAKIGGGFDAFNYFFKDTLWSVPPWVHVILKPLALLPWPYSYALLTFFTILMLGIIKNNIGGKWWLAVFSAPVFWEVWSGQVDWLVAFGIILAIQVLNGRLRPLWLGVAWILMLSKPWVGIFVLFALTWFAYQQYGWKQLLPAAAVSAGVILITFIYRPSWYLNGEVLNPFLLVSRHTLYSTNGSLWPWGLLAWVLIPGVKSRPVLLRRLLAVTMLTSPFLHLYHASVLISLTNNKKIDYAMFVIGWAIVATGIFQFNWSSLSWIYPLSYLLLDWGSEKITALVNARRNTAIPISNT
jgi:hypothetical protein